MILNGKEAISTKIPFEDHVFNECPVTWSEFEDLCNAYQLEEEKAMGILTESKKYKFRLHTSESGQDGLTGDEVE